MIRTVTLNTGFDETFTVSGVGFGEVADVLDWSELPSGKGINAARTVRALGHTVVAYGLIGADDASRFRAALLAEGITPVLVEVPGRTRRNLTLVSADADRPAAHFRAPGFDLQETAALRHLREMLTAQVEPGDVVTINGSVPRGAPDDTWAALAGAVLPAARLIVDVHGPALPAVVGAAGRGIRVCTPNAHEVEALPGIAALPAENRGPAALRFLAEQGVALPVVTRGRAGALFACDGAIWTAPSPARSARLAVGAGDAFAGAVAVGTAEGLPPGRELACLAMAVAAAHVESIAAGQLRQELPVLRDRVTVERVGDL